MLTCTDCGIEKPRIHLLERGIFMRCVNCHILKVVPTKWVIESDFMRKKGWHIDAGYDETIWEQVEDVEVRKAATLWHPNSEITWPDGTTRPTFYKY